MSNITLPPTPYQSPVIDKNGFLTNAWANWFKQLFLRSGGASAPSITALQTDIGALQASVHTAQTNILTLQTSVAANTASIATLQSEINGLGQGRYL